MFCYDDNTQSFTGATWTATGQSAQSMLGATERVSGATKFRIFYLPNPTFGATGAGVISVSVSPIAASNGIIPVSISGWHGVAITEGRASASGGETNPAPFNLLGVAPNSLVLHGVCGSSSGNTIPLTPETVVIEGALGTDSSLGAREADQRGGRDGHARHRHRNKHAYRRGRDRARASHRATSIYYVDASATGNNSANGLSPSTPWKTITKVNGSTFQPGDTILFAGGQTFTGGLSFTATSWNRTVAATNPVTIGSYGTGRATINSGSAYGFISENLGGLHLRDLVFQGNNTASTHGVMIWNSEAGAGKIQYVRVTNLLIQGYGNSGFILYGANAPGSSAGFNDVIIDSVVATDNTKAGGVTGTSGIRVAGSLGYMANPAFPTHTNVTIRNCATHGNPGIAGAANWTGSGIVVGEVEDGLIEYCTAYNNGANSNSVDGPVGIFAYSSNRVTIQYCESYNNSAGNAVDGGGFDLDVGMTNSVIQYCYSHGNAGPGFMMYNQTGAITPTWDNNTIRYCISQNDAVGRSAWGSGAITISKSNATMTNPRVYNNTIYTNSAVAATCYIGMDGTGTISGGLVANNIFYASAGAWLVNTEIYNPTGVTFQKNDYYALVAANFKIKWNNSTYSGTGGLTSWGRDATGLTSDPQLFSAGNGGTIGGYVVGLPSAYRLVVGSPMIGAGLNMSTTFSINPGTKDFFSTTIPVSTTFEIGAYEGPGV